MAIAMNLWILVKWPTLVNGAFDDDDVESTKGNMRQKSWHSIISDWIYSIAIAPLLNGRESDLMSLSMATLIPKGSFPQTQRQIKTPHIITHTHIQHYILIAEYHSIFLCVIFIRALIFLIFTFFTFSWWHYNIHFFYRHNVIHIKK